jgi:hypothetical protein
MTVVKSSISVHNKLLSTCNWGTWNSCKLVQWRGRCCNTFLSVIFGFSRHWYATRASCSFIYHPWDVKWTHWRPQLRDDVISTDHNHKEGEFIYVCTVRIRHLSLVNQMTFGNVLWRYKPIKIHPLKPKAYCMYRRLQRTEILCSAHNSFMCFAWISEQTAIVSLYSINLAVFITEAENVYCAVRTGYLNQTAIVSSLKGWKGSCYGIFDIVNTFRAEKRLIY